MSQLKLDVTIRLSQKLVPDDPLAMDYEFPAQAQLDHLMKNDHKALEMLELKAILNNGGGGMRWNFILNDGKLSAIDNGGYTMTQRDLDLKSNRIAKIIMHRDTGSDSFLAGLVLFNQDEKQFLSLG
jgi:hypothetical protein